MKNFYNQPFRQAQKSWVRRQSSLLSFLSRVFFLAVEVLDLRALPNAHRNDNEIPFFFYRTNAMRMAVPKIAAEADANRDKSSCLSALPSRKWLMTKRRLQTIPKTREEIHFHSPLVCGLFLREKMRIAAHDGPR